MVYTYNGISFSLRMKRTLSLVTTWMNLEDITLSEIRQSKSDKHSNTAGFHLYTYPK